ncbi:MAG: PKD domain-containing protein [Planctomycetes bacterium]|nr:PKD domain-containing protein [Planctomycetota bacterium]
MEDVPGAGRSTARRVSMRVQGIRVPRRSPTWRWPMRFMLSFGIVLSLASWLPASGPYSDDFGRDDGPPDGWISTKGAPAMIEVGELILATDGTNESWVWIDSRDFLPDYTLEFDVVFEPSGSVPEVGRHGGVMFCANQKTDRYSTTMTGYVMDWIDRTTDHGYRFHKWTNGGEVPIIPDSTFFDTVDPGKHWAITVRGTTLIFEVDGEVKGVVDDPDYRGGYIGFWGWVNRQRIHIDNVKVTQPIDVKATAAPPSGTVPLTVTFDGGGSTTPAGTITSHEWDFGDGQTGTGAQVQHTYTAAGVYRPKLTVANSNGDFAACSLETAITATCPPGDVSPWQSKDVGGPLFPGSAGPKGPGCIEVCAGGREIGRMADQFHYVYQETTGDNLITAQLNEVVAWQTALPQSRAGLMFRYNLDPNSPFAMMAVQPTGTGVKTVFLSRKNPTSNVATRTVSGIVVDPPGCYLKIERKGAEFIGYARATEAEDWKEYHRVTLEAPPDTLFVGPALVATDAKSQGLTADVVFCGVTLGVSEPPPNAPQNLAATAGDGKVDLAWDEPAAGGGTFTGYRIFQDGIAIADAPLAPRTHTASGLTNGVNYCFKVRATRGGVSSPDSNERCVTPEGPPVGPVFHRGDSDDNGQLQLTDAIRVLGYLFLGAVEPTCLDAADADGNNQLQLTDAIRILGFLFLGGDPPVSPGPPDSPCGLDNDETHLGCTSYTHCG